MKFQLDIRTKLYIFFAVITLFTIVGGFFAYRTIQDTEQQFTEYVTEASPRAQTLIEMRELATRLSSETEQITQKASSGAPLESSLVTLLALSGQTDQLYQDYRALGAEALAFTNLLGAKDELVLSVVDYVRAVRITSLEEREDVLPEDGDDIEGDAVSTSTTASLEIEAADVRAQSEELQEAINDAFGSEAEAEEEASDAVAGSVTRSVRVLSITLVGVIAILALLGFVLHRLVFVPLSELRSAALDVARGKSDRTANITSKDELGDVARAFNMMLTRVRHAQEAVEEKAKKLSDTLFELGMLQKSTAEERALYERLLQSIGDAVLVIDRDLTVSLANDHAAELLRRDKEELEGKPAEKLFDLWYREGHEELNDADLWRKAFKSTDPIVFENQLAFTDERGVDIPVALVVAPVLDENKKAREIIVTFRDITELVRLEEARVSFISAASHQLRTPLSSMRWFTEMFLDGDLGKLTKKQKHAIETFSESTLHMIDLVNSLLQLSRVEAKRVEVKPEPVQLDELAEEVVESLSQQAEEKGLEIDVRTEGDIPVVQMDPSITRQVIMNYLTNAIRYSDEKTAVYVDIKLREKDIKLSVTNEGIGIPEDAQDRIFQKFFRASNAQQAVPNGNGIGLAFVKLLVQDWGGNVGFESVPNETTTFWATVPLSGMKAREGEVNLKV